MQQVELELTYLAKHLPEGLVDCPSKKIVSISVPSNAAHSTLRLRQLGDKYEITRKVMAEGNDSSHMIEHTIELSPEEFAELSANSTQRFTKTRYYYPYQGLTAEIDIFGGALQGLVTIDFEFTSREEQLRFEMPDFCLADVTQEQFVSGGALAGKSYQDVASKLQAYDYKPLSIS